MSIVFASAAPALGDPDAAPHRSLGRVFEAPGRLTERMNDQVHVKAEFFAQGVGWVPVDLSSAVLHDRSPEGLRYFGNDSGDFVTFHVDSDMTVETYFGRRTIEWLQVPSYWVIGVGSLDGLTTRSAWKVASEPVEFREAALRKSAGGAAPADSSKTAKSPRRRPRR